MAIYDSRRPLRRHDTPNGLERFIGVLIADEFTFQAVRTIEIVRYTPVLNERCLGSFAPAAEQARAIADATTATLRDIDAAIAELQAHRDRLAAELAAI